MPSSFDVDSSTAATTKYDAIAPASRAVMSKAPPARSASFETVATTSPVVRRPRTAGPVRAAWCATTWIIRKLACSQLLTATRCRSVPATAWTTPRPNRTPAQANSALVSPVPTPSSMARPSTHGRSACASIQTIPKVIPSRSVPTWWRPTQSRNLVWERRSGVPGSAKGSCFIGGPVYAARPRNRP